MENNCANRATPSFYEFFAGGGMVRAGLGDDWTCHFANDFDPKKANTYTKNWNQEAFSTGDIADLTTQQLPGRADLAWASFPCQDLSLAGKGAGLTGERSGSFWKFCQLMEKLGAEKRQPNIIALENVCGTLTANGGEDFKAICAELSSLGYRYGAMVIDAKLFLPQSRPRLFIVAVQRHLAIAPGLISHGSDKRWHSARMITALNNFSDDLIRDWIWWSLPEPISKIQNLEDIIDDEPTGVKWHTADETADLIAKMDENNRLKLNHAESLNRCVIGTVYKRTRPDSLGNKVQRAEIRFDGTAGCLRTPGGGSSRQLIVVVKGKNIRSRLISPRETARLMGLPESYALPEGYNEAYHLTGDGVAVPVVKHLRKYLLDPIFQLNLPQIKAAA